MFSAAIALESKGLGYIFITMAPLTWDAALFQKRVVQALWPALPYAAVNTVSLLQPDKSAWSLKTLTAEDNRVNYQSFKKCSYERDMKFSRREMENRLSIWLAGLIWI